MTWTNGRGVFYEGDRQAGDREATADEVSALALERAKAAKGQEIAAALAAAIAAGLAWKGACFQIDPASQQRIQARAQLARAAVDGKAAWGAEFAGWIAADNSRPEFTAAEFWEFGQAIHARVTALTLRARDLKDALAAASTLDDVAAIDAGVGWAQQ